MSLAVFPHSVLKNSLSSLSTCDLFSVSLVAMKPLVLSAARRPDMVYIHERCCVGLILYREFPEIRDLWSSNLKQVWGLYAMNWSLEDELYCGFQFTCCWCLIGGNHLEIYHSAVIRFFFSVFVSIRREGWKILSWFMAQNLCHSACNQCLDVMCSSKISVPNLRFAIICCEFWCSILLGSHNGSLLLQINWHLQSFLVDQEQI